jgi:hypothetical protein
MQSPTERSLYHALFGVTAAVCLAMTAVLFVLDVLTPLGLFVSALYSLPLLISLLADSRVLTFGLAALCTALVPLASFLCPVVHLRWIVATDSAIVILVIWICAVVGLEMTRAKRRIHELSKWLTICLFSKKIKVDDRWLSIEEYLTKYCDLKVTHGLTPEMVEKFLRDSGSNDQKPSS